MNEGKKILVVDDEEAVVTVIKAHLSADGYTVVAASSGQEALNQVQESRPDLVLLDIRLGEEHGLQILKSIKELEQNLPVIIVTGFYDNAEAEEAFGCGAADYMTKPIDFYYLKNTIEAQLG